MSVQKIVTYVAAVLGVVGLIFQITILSKGDDVIETAALSGDYGDSTILYSRIYSNN